MNNPKFFRFPFAALGDKSSIEDTIQENGNLSYAEGYGYDYERNPATDPQAKRIEHDKMNQLHHDITNNIRQYQLYGVPWFYDANDNGGVNLSYQKGAMVRYNDGVSDNIYCSLVDNNTTTPKDKSKWTLADPNIYALQDGSRNHAQISGTANALIATLNPAPKTLMAGMEISIFTQYNNTGAATLNLNGLGAKNILYNDGSALIGNDWNKNSLITLIYDGVNAWRLNLSQSIINNSINTALAKKQDDVRNVKVLKVGANLPSALTAVELYANGDGKVSGSIVCRPENSDNYTELSNRDKGNLLLNQYNPDGDIKIKGGKNFTRNGQNIWFGGRQQFSENGYQIFPSGLILQWGKVYTIGDDVTVTISLPMSFSSQFLNITCSFETVNNGNQYITIAGAKPNGLGSFLLSSELNTGTTLRNLFWQAIGY